jgi:polyisoprenoid-binding protein YceI
VIRVLFAFVAASVALPVCAQEVYVADPPHTYAYFATGHLGISWLRGRFNETAVQVTLDRAAKSGTIEAEITTASLDTGHQARDKHLRSPDYLDVEQHPKMTFKSNQLRFNGDVLVGADGELTLMGITKPVSLKVSSFGCRTHPRNKREICGAEAETAIKRSEFGIRRGATGIGDDVKITIQIEAYRQ